MSADKIDLPLGENGRFGSNFPFPEIKLPETEPFDYFNQKKDCPPPPPHSSRYSNQRQSHGMFWLDGRWYYTA